jgi:hypothetical protein
VVRVGVVSDTHVPDKARFLPAALLRAFEGVDLIVHAGDLIVPEVIDALARVAPVHAVAGNNDPRELVESLGRRRIVAAGGVRIGLVHGDRGRGRNTPDRAARAFSAGEVDWVVFGHSHLPYLGPPQEVPGQPPAPAVTLFNPGSPTDRRHAPRKSFGFLEIEDGKATARHVML